MRFNFKSWQQCAPERGFSINKIMLDAHGYCMQESTIEALRLVKDELLRIGGAMKFNIATDLILEVKGAYWKYIADLEQKKAMEDAIKRDKEKMSNGAKKIQEGKYSARSHRWIHKAL